MTSTPASVERRYKKDRMFRRIGLVTVLLTAAFLAVILVAIAVKGWPAFMQTRILLDFDLSEPAYADPQRANYRKAVGEALAALFPEVEGRGGLRRLNSLVSRGAQFNLRDHFLEAPPEARTPERIRLPVIADDLVDLVVRGEVDRNAPESRRLIGDDKLAWIGRLEAQGRIETVFNARFFTQGTSREPEQAGILAALVSSILTLLITFALTFPTGVASAIYLEEFAPQNRLTDFIEVNINNLAAVPSIIFGLLGLAIFINFFGVPRSTPVIGGLVLALMTLPTIIIASRAAIKAVPPSIREGALALGASRMQVVFHHVVPLAMPGMLTGSIIGMAQAMGETAPLLIIGMVAFVVDVPGGLTDPASALPVQIYLWAGNPERSFTSLAAAAIMVLLAVLFMFNILAVFLRKRFERRW